MATSKSFCDWGECFSLEAVRLLTTHKVRITFDFARQGLEERDGAHMNSVFVVFTCLTVVTSEAFTPIVSRKKKTKADADFIRNLNYKLEAEVPATGHQSVNSIKAVIEKGARSWIISNVKRELHSRSD